MANASEFKSLRAAETKGSIKAADLIDQALRLHPLSGKTPRATAGTTLVYLTRDRLAKRTKPAHYAITPKGRKAVQAN